MPITEAIFIYINDLLYLKSVYIRMDKVKALAIN